MSSSLPPLPTSPDDGPLVSLVHTYGSVFLGTIASMGFFGIFTLQCYLYIVNYPKDSRIMKFVVGFVWILEFLRAVFSVHAVYHYLVLKWGNVPALAISVWSVNINLIFTSLVQCIVHACFTFRVWILSKRNIWLTALIGFLAFSNFVFGVATFVVSTIVVTFKNIQGAGALTGIFSTVGLASAIAADLLITASLSWFIWRAGTRSESSSFGSTILFKRMVFILVNLGLLTSLSDIGVLILSDMPETEGPTLWFYSLYIIVGNFYANSLLATLNARTSLRRPGGSSGIVTTGLSSTRTPRSGLSAPSFPPNPVDVELTELTSSQTGSLRDTKEKIGLGVALTDGDLYGDA